MRFTEHEMTVGLTGAAKTVLAARDRGVRRGRRTVDQAWADLGGYGRFKVLDGLGDQVLPVLVALPDVAVEPGTRPTFTDAQVRAAVEERLGGVRGLRRAALVKARVALVRMVLDAMPVRRDPDALT